VLKIIFEEFVHYLLNTKPDKKIKEQEPHCWEFRGVTDDEVQDLRYKVKV
jgi:hypothetical protein